MGLVPGWDMYGRQLINVSLSLFKKKKRMSFLHIALSLEMSPGMGGRKSYGHRLGHANHTLTAYLNFFNY